MTTTRILLVALGAACFASTIFMGVFGKLEGEIEQAAPMWQPMILYACIGVAHWVAAAWLAPGRPPSWTWAVCVTMTGLFNCLFFPVSLYTLYRLFKLKPVVFKT